MTGRPLRRPRVSLVWAAGLGCALVVPAVMAQSGRAWTLGTYASISETLTDNARLTHFDRLSDAITALTAGVRASGRSARTQFSLDYALTGTYYANDTSSNNVQNRLAATLHSEPVENWFTIDASANITQQTISAFGVQSPDAALGNSNRTETRSLSVTPAIRGSLAGWADYRIFGTYSATNTDADRSRGDFNSVSSGASLAYSGARPLGWSIDLTHNEYNYSERRPTVDDRASFSLIYKPSYDLRLSASTGYENTNQISIRENKYDTWGVGIQWQPSPRTTFEARRDERFFGKSYHLNFQHRFSRSLVRLTGSQDIDSPYSQTASGASQTSYDLYFAQFAAIEPDETRRDQLVRAFLQNIGINPNAPVVATGGYIAAGPTVVRRWDLSYALQGARSTLSFGVGTSDSVRASALAIDNPDLIERLVVRQRHWSVGVGHRLTPTAGLSLDLSEQRTLDSGSVPGNTMYTMRLAYTASLGPRTTGSLEARHVQFDSTTSPYIENALIARVSMSF